MLTNTTLVNMPHFHFEFIDFLLLGLGSEVSVLQQEAEESRFMAWTGPLILEGLAQHYNIAGIIHCDFLVLCADAGSALVLSFIITYLDIGPV